MTTGNVKIIWNKKIIPKPEQEVFALEFEKMKRIWHQNKNGVT